MDDNFHQEKEIVPAMANRQQNVALTLFCRFVKATKQCRFEPPPLPARRYFWSLWQRDKETFL